MLFTSFVIISEQYLEYYAKKSLFNLIGSKSEVTKNRIQNSCSNMFVGKGYPLEAKTTPKTESVECASFLNQTS